MTMVVEKYYFLDFYLESELSAAYHCDAAFQRATIVFSN